MTYDELIRHYGSAMNAADAINVSRQAVHRWKENGVPIEQQILYEVDSKGALLADLPAEIRVFGDPPAKKAKAAA